ncbi:CPBP family intramembrane glutamic endopeptidase [Hymenobacter cavernae]|uniref:CAAX prenyl protease 2/Lysostaphin resistance protein A-like domain-containing protein n=1 Tax=Hymenobacter cavernae TaxID=2044852 RepID=A0ABQ1TZX9_9BACT|nr:type II CAAX endopeptidase family protein [Hymenobacter cavernae]GGF08030.1 hypothetical protein GCM10011383_18950 [Hymenobacter cavernae]
MPESTTKPRYAVLLTFFFLTGLLSAFFYYFLTHGIAPSAGRLYNYGVMWSPGVAALLTARLFRRDVSGLGWSWPRTPIVAWCYLIPLFYTLAAYLLVWFGGWGGFPNQDFVAQASVALGWGKLPAWLFVPCLFLFNAIWGMIPGMATALGEEIGWRGLLVPELARGAGYTQVSLITGIIWAVWHFPILLYGDYNNGAPAWYGLSCFTLLVVSISFVYTWFRLKTGSLWTGVLLHASHNLFVQTVFTPLTRDTGPTKYFIDEFGIALPVVCLVLAVLFWRKRHALVVTSGKMPAEVVQESRLR